MDSNLVTFHDDTPCLFCVTVSHSSWMSCWMWKHNLTNSSVGCVQLVLVREVSWCLLLDNVDLFHICSAEHQGFDSHCWGHWCQGHRDAWPWNSGALLVFFLNVLYLVLCHPLSIARSYWLQKTTFRVYCCCCCCCLIDCCGFAILWICFLHAVCRFVEAGCIT